MSWLRDHSLKVASLDEKERRPVLIRRALDAITLTLDGKPHLVFGGEAVEEDHHRRPGGRCPRRPDPPGLHRCRRAGQHPLVRGHHLFVHRDLGRVAIPLTVIDIASRRVVGFAIADHLRTELVADALELAA